MSGRVYALLGMIGPVIAFVFIGFSIAFSPWFRWEVNALSDLGHATRSGVAPIYNFGLLLTGFLVTVYSVTAMRTYARWTSCSLLFSAFTLQLVALFDEVYGYTHYFASYLLFVSFGFASIIYAVERKSVLALMAFVIGFLTWILYWGGICSAGVAVPETISSLAVLSWILSSALKIYFMKTGATTR